MDDSKRRLMEILPHLMVAANMAKMQEPDGEVCLAVVSKKPDGSGRLTASFECPDFFRDMLIVLGFQEMQQLVEELERLHKEEEGQG